jgi:hypothetical protein
MRLDHAERRHRLRLALQRQRLDRLDLDRVAHQRVGGLADVDLVGRRRRLQPRGDVDRVAGGELLVGGGVVAGHHLAGVHAGAVGQLHAVALGEVGVDRLQRRLHADRRAHGAQRVVLVRARQAEHRHDRVADVLLDLAAVALDLRRHGLEVALLDLVHRLAVEPLAERRGVLQIREEQGDGLADLLGRQRRRARRMQRRAAVAAQLELGRVLFAAARALDHGRALASERRGRAGDGAARRLGWSATAVNRACPTT